MALATSRFVQKSTTQDKGHALPYHLWPKSVQHDVRDIRKRTNAHRHLATFVVSAPNTLMVDLSDAESPHHLLWTRVNHPLILRTVASRPSGPKPHIHT
jgi:hypothetical protein